MFEIIAFVGGAAVGAYFGPQVRAVFAWAKGLISKKES